MKLSNLIKHILPKIAIGKINEGYIRDVFKLENIQDSTVNIQDINIGAGNTIDKSKTYNFYNVNVQQTPESHLTQDNSKTLAEKIKPIEELIASGLTYKAIEAYNQLLYDNFDLNLSVNDRFSIYNGLLNCYVNINEDDDKIKYLITKIDRLGEVKELHRFLYIQSVFYYNRHDIPKAIFFNDKALKLKHDYLNAILFKTFLDAVNETIPHKNAVEFIISHPKYTSGTIKEIISMKTIIGDILNQFKEYEEAIKYNEEANELIYSAQRELAIGVSYYFLASINKDETTDTIKYNDIDYDALNKAVEIFNNLYNTKNAEVKKTLYKHLMPFYFSCLHLTQKPKEIIKISSEAREYIDVNNNNLMRVKAMAELSLGEYDEKTIENFTPEEKLKFEIFSLSEKGKYEELVDKAKSIIDDYKFKDDRHLQYVYLDSLMKSHQENNNDFLTRYKKIINVDPHNEPIKMLLVLYYERTNEIPQAKELLMNLLKESTDALTFLDASRFLEKNGYEEELGIVLDKVFSGEYKIRELDRSEFIKRKFFYLQRQPNIPEIYRLYDSLDKSTLNEIDYTQMSIEYYRLKGDVLNVALQFEHLYTCTGNNEYYLRSATYFLKANDLIKTESILKFLRINKLIETSELYMLYSSLQVLYSNYEKAFEYAKKARELDEHIPKANSHPFFAGISLRCNRVDDWMASMQEYLIDYPNNGWIKTIKVIEEDENGETRLTKEGKDVLISGNERHQTLQNAFISHQIGISTYIKLCGNASQIVHLVSAKNYYKQKLKITSGNILEVQETTQLIKDEILVDSLSLFVLAEADLLNLLNQFKTVYITYTTIEYLQAILLSIESPIIRSIFNYIENSINTNYVPVDTAIILDFKQKDAYLTETVHCASYSFENNIPFLNSDITLKVCLKNKGNNVVNMVAMLRSLQQKNEEISKLISNAIVKLKTLYYDFINFNAIDLYNLSLIVTSKEDMIEKFKIYLSMDRYSDCDSFIGVYIEFLKSIYNTIPNEVFLDYARMFLNYIDNYISKSTHYFHLLAIEYPQYKEELFGLIRKNNIFNLNVFETERNFDFSDIIYSKEFLRARDIMYACTKGIYSFLSTFGKSEDDFRIYHQFIKEVCVKIDMAIIDRINDIKKTH